MRSTNNKTNIQQVLIYTNNPDKQTVHPDRHTSYSHVGADLEKYFHEAQQLLSQLTQIKSSTYVQ